MRTWTSLPEMTFEAEYVNLLFDDVILKEATGRELRIPLTRFSGEDLKYIELANPPKLSVDAMKSVSQDFIATAQFPTGGTIPEPPTLLKYQFGARVKQLDAKTYNHELKIEIYALTQQRYDQDKYHLICKAESKPFVMSKENGRRYEFTDKNQHRLLTYTVYVDYLGWEELRGETYGENLILVRDERGEIVAYNSTKNWLYDIRDQLEELPVGAWLDRTGTRVHPTPPKATKAPGAAFL